MSDTPREHAVVTLERNVLRRLCRGGGIASVPRKQQQSLRDHSWSEPDHRIVYEALMRLARVPRSSLREHLPSEATRMGYPDIHWDAYFEGGAGESEADRTVGELIEELIAESARSQ